MSTLVLQNEATLEDLEKGVEFEIELNENQSSDESFDDEAYDDFKDTIYDPDDTNKTKGLGYPTVTFDVLQLSMQPITEDGLIVKEVLKSGVGPIIPEKATVLMHYEAYVEERKEPFDSSRLRNKPHKFLLEQGSLIPGLDVSVKTMRKGEIAKFLVSHEHAFGEFGCPPRIPRKAQILYEVEILNFYDSKDIVEFEDLTPEEKRKAPFEKIIGVYEVAHQMGNDLFRAHKYKSAIARYRNAMNILEKFSVANEEEDEKRKGYLLKLYLNLAESYLKLKNAQKTIMYAGLGLKLDPENIKGLYRMGMGLYLEDSYDRAEYFLSRAKEYKPYDSTINSAIKNLELKRKQYNDWERKFYRKGLELEEEGATKKTSILEEFPAFSKEIKDEMNTFLESDKNELAFSPGYTESQLEVVKILAQDCDLAFISKIQCGVKINKVAKKRQST